MHLINFMVLAAAIGLVQAHNLPKDKPCCDAKCYKRMVYADSHDMGDASKDCKSYYKTTATPCPSTVTKYTTATVTATICPKKATIKYGRRDALEPRNNVPAKCTPKYSRNEQPGYANGYCKSGEWAAACSCLGGSKPTTVTLPASTTTVTKPGATTTKTITSCSSTTTTTSSSTTSSSTKTTSSTTTYSTTTTASTTTSSSTTSSSTTTTSSSAPQPTTCNEEQTNFCTSQQQNVCLCQLDTDGVTPVCSNGAICPQSQFPNPFPPCSSDLDCALDYPGSPYTKCVYTDADFFCSPTYCASLDGCFQQTSTSPKRRSVNDAMVKVWEA